jgi:hypothetical protein
MKQPKAGLSIVAKLYWRKVVRKDQGGLMDPSRKLLLVNTASSIVPIALVSLVSGDASLQIPNRHC